MTKLDDFTTTMIKEAAKACRDETVEVVAVHGRLREYLIDPTAFINNLVEEANEQS